MFTQIYHFSTEEASQGNTFVRHWAKIKFWHNSCVFNIWLFPQLSTAAVLPGLFSYILLITKYIITESMPSSSLKSIPAHSTFSHSHSTAVPSFFVFIKKSTLILSFLTFILIWFFPMDFLTKIAIAWTAMIYVMSRFLKFAARG